MKIAWFTPFSKRNGISRYSQLITNELINRCDVDLWLSEDKDLLPTELKMFHYQSSDDLSSPLNKYDFIIYNMGNNFDFHKDIYEVSKKVKGCIILHDFVMHHFFAAYYLEYKASPNRYVDDMRLLYGADGRNKAMQSIKSKHSTLWETEEIVEYPLFEKTIEGALGVIAHSHFLTDKVKQRFLGPVRTIYHPYMDDYSFTQGDIRKTDLGIPEDKTIMVTVGHVNPNKRIDKIIEVLGTKKDIAQKVAYFAIGPHNHTRYVIYLQSLIRRYKLQKVVKLAGFQSDSKFAAYMQHADIFLNLRFPATEGAPWSLVEQLYCGKPVIVTDTGFCSEIPDDCVVKIGMDNEEKDIYRTCKRLIGNEKLRKEIGRRGRKFAIKTFTVNNYCQSFFKFLKEVQEYQSMLGLVDRIGQELASMGISEDVQVVDTIAQEIYTLFAGKEK